MVYNKVVLLLVIVASVYSQNITEKSGDDYLDSAYVSCQNKDVLSCAKYRALNYIQKVAMGRVSTGRGFSHLPMMGNLRLIKLNSLASGTDEVFELFDAQSRSSDSELMRVYRFGLRAVERFARTYAVSVPIPESQQGIVPQIVDQDDLDNGRALGDESRGKKKKLAMLLPLMVLFKFLKLKILLVPILLGVLAIKKILLLAAIFLPSMLSMIKFCKQPPLYHEYSAAPAYDYGVTAYGASGASGATYGKEYSRRNYEAQNLAYRAQTPVQQ